MSVSEIDFDFRPRYLVPWLSDDQGKIYAAKLPVEDEVYVISCPPPGVETGRPPRRPPAGPYFLASFAAEPALMASPTRGFLMARRRRRGFEVEDSRNTPKGVESFGKVVVPRIPSMREVIALLDVSLNRGGEILGPILPTWQETLRERRRRFPGEWTFQVRSLNYPQLPEWYRRQWDALV